MGKEEEEEACKEVKSYFQPKLQMEFEVNLTTWDCLKIKNKAYSEEQPLPPTPDI